MVYQRTKGQAVWPARAKVAYLDVLRNNTHIHIIYIRWSVVISNDRALSFWDGWLILGVHFIILFTFLMALEQKQKHLVWVSSLQYSYINTHTHAHTCKRTQCTNEKVGNRKMDAISVSGLSLLLPILIDHRLSFHCQFRLIARVIAAVVVIVSI